MQTEMTASDILSKLSEFIIHELTNNTQVTFTRQTAKLEDLDSGTITNCEWYYCSCINQKTKDRKNYMGDNICDLFINMINKNTISERIK